MTWIPAFAGMTSFFNTFSESVIPAKAGIQSGFSRMR